MELTGEQLKITDTLLKRYLPRSQQVYGCLVLKNRVRSDLVRVFADRWPEFNVLACKPQYEQKGDLFKDTLVFAKDESSLEETMRKSSVIDWTRYALVTAISTFAQVIAFIFYALFFAYIAFIAY